MIGNQFLEVPVKERGLFNMKLITTTGRLETHFGLKKAIDILVEAGYDALDLSMFNNKKHYNGEYDKDFYLDIKKYAQSKGISFMQAHAPFGSSFPNEEQTKQRFGEIVTSIKNASYLGVKIIVVHPCQHLDFHVQGNPEKLFEYNMDFYKKLIPYCEEYDIKVAVENMWQMPHHTQIGHSTCSRPEEFIKYLDTLNNDSIVGCLDIGHTMLVSEEPDAFIRALGNKRLKCLHTHDVNVNQDSHTLPFFGIIDWESVMKSLADIDYQGELTYEADSFFDREPLELHQDAANFMAKTGRYLISKFNEYRNN